MRTLILLLAPLAIEAQPIQSTLIPITPCRMVDTRNPVGPLGGPILVARIPRTFPILSGTCLPTSVKPAAYAINVTIVPPGATPRKLNLSNPVGFVTVWPTGQTMPIASTLNSWLGTVAANFAVIASGAAGSIDVYATDPCDLIIDVMGYYVRTDSILTYGLGLMTVTFPDPDGGPSTTQVLIDTTVVQTK